MPEGKRLVLKAGGCGGVYDVRGSLLEYSCSFRDSSLLFLDTKLFIF